MVLACGGPACSECENVGSGHGSAEEFGESQVVADRGADGGSVPWVGSQCRSGGEALGFATVGKEMDLVVLREQSSIRGNDGRTVAGFGIRFNNSAMAVDNALCAAGKIGEVRKSCAGVGGV